MNTTSHRDLRPPQVIVQPNGRLKLYDPAVMDPAYGVAPADEPAPRGMRIHGLRPVRLSFQGRPRC